MTVSCIACGGDETTLIGKLPVFTPDFLGQPLTETVDAGSLYRCGNCSLLFRWPMPDPETLLAYYRGLDKDEWWQHEPDRKVWRYAAKQLKNIPTPSVLDVGCFRGNMLREIGKNLSCFGVEPSPSARREAEAHRITVIGDSIDSLQGETRRFGAITLIDVAEHLPRPLESLQILSGLLVSGGKLIIFTGATDAVTWQFARQDYWYCAMPEHVAFFSPSWFRWAAAQLGFRVSTVERLPYQPVAFPQRTKEALQNISFVMYRRLERSAKLGPLLSRMPLIHRIGNWQSCWWTSARDHILVTMTRDSLR
jgi:SAM-dependent methyltransferase